MKECDFTPGPWHVSNEGELVIRDDEWLIPVATAGYANNDEEIATANLIAAAPDLLEALQTIQAKMSDFIKLANEVGINDADGFYLAAATGAEEQARAAISKALGEE